MLVAQTARDGWPTRLLPTPLVKEVDFMETTIDAPETKSTQEASTTDADNIEAGIWYVGFPGEKGFVDHVTEYTALAGETSKIPDALISDTLTAFMENALDHYFVAPLDTLQASEKHRKIVMVGVNTIRKAVSAVLRKVVTKMSPEDRVKLAQYMNTMVAPPNETHPTSMVIYPIDDAMAQSAQQLIQRGRNGEAMDVKVDLKSLLIQVNDEAMTAYFDIPFQMMTFGPIMRKLVTMTADATRTATQVVIKKVVAGLSEEEMLRMFDYVESLFVTGPAHTGPLQPVK